jgi:hypothetical protein
VETAQAVTVPHFLAAGRKSSRLHSPHQLTALPCLALATSHREPQPNGAASEIKLLSPIIPWSTHPPLPDQIAVSILCTQTHAHASAKARALHHPSERITRPLVQNQAQPTNDRPSLTASHQHHLLSIEQQERIPGTADSRSHCVCSFENNRRRAPLPLVLSSSAPRLQPPFTAVVTFGLVRLRPQVPTPRHPAPHLSDSISRPAAILRQPSRCATFSSPYSSVTHPTWQAASDAVSPPREVC